MLPDRVSNPGPLTYESGALPIALRGPAPVTLIKSLRMTLTFGIIMSSSAHIYTKCNALDSKQFREIHCISSFPYTVDPRHNDTVCYQRFGC